ncbi:DUF748 domain-containing protein [Fodinibius salsisoli]|uniref:AsmA-like C-terminal region n=1 Tax=Fodinibius salsisoli TaxID=2820877 RepID=A0ABT3PS08_9BACT|nr:AsmA-like C-terminal region-containing protein [Fodinibius salsisoli]MCW9708652.1 hypothetical protein [Fodinibius salsisoli]
MKAFLKIIGGFFALLVVIIVGLNLYFTNDRLQNMLMPYLNEAVGRPVEVESMSVTFFSTFPQPGVEINKLSIPAETEEDTLISLDRMVAGVDLFSLFAENINFSEIELNRPQFTYKVFADSTTNLDFLLEQEETDTTASESYNINIPYFQITEGHFGYQDFTSNTSAALHDLNGDLSLNYADSIRSSIDMEVQQVSATVDSTTYLDGLPLSLTEESIFYPDDEIIQLREGTFAIRGLEMDLVGTLSNWSQTLSIDLQFNSSSDNFGDLLTLLPENEYTQGLETEGSLDLGGTIRGAVTEDAIPNFNIRMLVQNGYLKDPDLPQPIEDIRISASATNELVTIDTLNALAGANSLTGSGELQQPLEDNGTFNMDFIADVDLSTVNEFYDISELDLQQLAGQLDVNANAEGQLDQPEQAAFNGKAILADGLLKYQDVPKAITNINVNASGTQDLLTIQSLSLQAAENSFSAEGQVQHLLDEGARSINDMNTNLNFDLATIKEFYPIDEDTLRLEGMLTAQAILDGKADQIEQAVQSGSINLKDGLIDYDSFDAPFRNITFDAVLEGPQMTIVEGSLQSGDNNVQASGVINNYISENRSLNIKTEGSAKLKEISNYYDLEPDITDLSGDADFNLAVQGPANDPSAMFFSGKLTVKNGNMAGESLREPVKDLNGTFSLSPDKASLNNLTFQMGSSDIDVKGSLSNYMAYLKDEKNRKVTPKLTGQYYSKYLNLDELIDWSDTTSTNFNLELPDLNSNVSTQIDQMKITGVTMRNLEAKATSTPKQINLTQANVELFEGKANGTMLWEIPPNKPSTFNFKGALDSLRLESFFEEYPILGKNSQFYKFIAGTFSTSVDYTTKIDTELNPLIPTTLLNGTFGMSEAQVHNHPLQQKLSGFTKIKTLQDVVLDQWKSSIAIDKNILTISDLSLTSKDIGLELNGTQNLQNDNIDFQISLLLPERFKSDIASAITSQAANALTRDNNTIMVPLRVTGNYSNPKVQPDQTVIQPIVKKYLKNKAGNAIKNLFGGDKKESNPDTTQTDTTTSN